MSAHRPIALSFSRGGCIRLKLEFVYVADALVAVDALSKTYAKALGEIETMRSTCDDLDELLVIAGIADDLTDRADQYTAHCARLRALFAEELSNDLTDFDSGQGMPGAGRSPAAKGHGCPAFASAVGPAPTGVQTADITFPDDPLFFAREGKELPPLRFCADNRVVLAGEILE